MRKAASILSIAFIAGWMFLSTGSTAQAGFLAPLIMNAGWFTAMGAVGQTVAATLLAVGASVLQMALMKKPPEGGGLSSKDQSTGDANPANITFGRYALGGSRVAYRYCQDEVGDGQPMDWLTAVVELGDVPITALDAVYIYGDRYRVTNQYGDNPINGFKLISDAEENVNDRAFVRFHDGTQTEADAFMLEMHGHHSERPWSDDMVGRGVPYAIVNFRYHQKRFSGFPDNDMLFEVRGAKLYDPRLDSSIGGNGPCRYGQPSTHVYSENPIVQAYNIFRGIRLSDGSLYGLDVDQNSLPVNKWFAAMNHCDELVEIDETGNTAPRYRSCYDFSVDREPAEVIAEILKACAGKVAESGGSWNVVCGAPAGPVGHIDALDVIIDEPRDYTIFGGLETNYNGAEATYPDPANSWQETAAIPYKNLDWIAEDDGREMIADLTYSACPFAMQVRGLMIATAADNRRQRSHTLTLPMRFMRWEQLDNITFSAPRHGYNNKLFEIETKQIDPISLTVTLTIRERDNSDFDRNLLEELIVPAFPSTNPGRPSIVGVPYIDATGIALTEGTRRVAAIRTTWSNTDDYYQVAYRIRKSGESDIYIAGTIPDLSQGMYDIVEGIFGQTSYEISFRPIMRFRTTEFGEWKSVFTPDARFTREDMADEILAELDAIEPWMEAIDEELAGISSEIDNKVATARDQLAGDIEAVSLALTNGLDSIDGRIETGIENYDVTVQGQLSSIAGQIEELTAALTSDNLFNNYDFKAGASGWTATNATFVAREGSSDSLLLAAPAELTHFANVGVGAVGNIRQTTKTFETTNSAASNNDKLQVKFWGAAVSNRNLRVDVQFKSGAGANIGSVVNNTFAVTNAWKSHSAQFDIPEGAINADVTFNKTQAGTRVAIGSVDSKVVNLAIEARITNLEVVTANTEAAFVGFRSNTIARFEANEGSISTEAGTRAAADGVLSGRIDLVSSVAGTNSATISTMQTTVANAVESIASLDSGLEAVFGSTQICRDPDFGSDFKFWPNGSTLSAASYIFARNQASALLPIREMPGRKSIGFNPSDTASRTTASYTCNPSEKLTLSAFIYRQSNASTGRVWIQFLDDAGALVGSSTSVTTSVIGSWTEEVIADIQAPATATQLRVGVSGGSGGSGTNLSLVLITGIRLKRQVGYDAISTTHIVEQKQALANANLSFGQLVAGSKSIFNIVDESGQIRANSLSNALTTYQTKADANSAIGALRNEVDSKYGDLTAGGFVKIYSVAAPTGAVSRVAIGAKAGTAANANSTAAMYLTAETDGSNSITMLTDRFALVNGVGPNAARTVPFYAAGGQVYIDSAVMRALSVDTIHLASGAATRQYTAYRAAAGTLSMSITNLPVAGQAILMVDGYPGNVFNPPGVNLTNSTGGFRVRVNGTIVETMGPVAQLGLQGSTSTSFNKLSAMRIIGLPAGNSTIAVEDYEGGIIQKTLAVFVGLR